MEAAIDAANERRSVALQKRFEHESKWPLYRELRLGFTFEGEGPGPTAEPPIAVRNQGFVSDGPFGRASRFNGETTLVIDELPIPEAGTWACWIRVLSDADDPMRIIDGNGFMIALQARTLVAGFHDGKSIVLRDRTPLTRGRWTHVALSWGSSTVSLYVDGARRAVADYSGVPGFPARKVTIGARWTGEQYHFVGDLDEVLFYDRPLGEDAILSLKEEGLFGGKLPSEILPNVY